MAISASVAMGVALLFPEPRGHLSTLIDSEVKSVTRHGTTYTMDARRHALSPCDIGVFRIGEIRPGKMAAGAGANEGHGLRRTNDDKRRAVMTLLNDEEWGGWSNREIARQCNVSDPFVLKLRDMLTANVSSNERTYTTKRGATATMDTTNIGKPPVPVSAAGEKIEAGAGVSRSRFRHRPLLAEICVHYARPALWTDSCRSIAESCIA